MKRIIGSFINRLLSPFGYEVIRSARGGANEKAEGFPSYLRQARKVDMDVNDWIEQELGWLPALPILEQTTFPYLNADSVVCELGVGTGRWSRHLAAKLPRGELHLVDHSPWIVHFLQDSFRENPRVHCHLGTGSSLPFKRDAWIDCVFSQGTFIELKLGPILLYAREFYRVVKPGGRCIFDFIDIGSVEGWNYLETQSLSTSYTYHTEDTIERVFSSCGFLTEKTYQIGKSTYFVVRKPGFTRP